MIALKPEYRILKTKASSHLRIGGFTMAELIVTLSIIMILITAAGFSINTALKQSRDNRRIADIEKIRTAFELYFQQHESYPNEAPFAQSIAGWETSVTTPDFLAELAPYLNNDVPIDPINTDNPASGTLDPRPNGDFYYAYHLYNSQANPGQHYGCDFDGDFVVLVIKSMESRDRADLPRARCGPMPCGSPAGGGGGENLGTANACRDWGNEFDYSLIIH